MSRECQEKLHGKFDSQIEIDSQITIKIDWKLQQATYFESLSIFMFFSWPEYT